MYFEKPGRINTEKTVELALKTAHARGLKHIVVSSCSGRSALLFKNENTLNIVCVTHVNGFSEKGKNELSEEFRAELIQNGIKVLTTTHVLSGAERGISNKFNGAYPVEIIAHTLRMFGQGIKVCVEIAVMALDSGLIPYDEPIVVVGGTGVGLDTCAILKPSHANNIFDTKISEIICKPV
jgi:hypothetical protein